MLRRVLAAVLPAAVALTALVTVVAPAPPTAHAADGLAFQNTTTYTIDPAAGVVHVRADLVLTNTLPDQRDGNIINRRYFRGFSLPVPADATNAVATDSNGRSLDVTRRTLPDTTDFVILDVDFANNLFYRSTARVAVTYDITGLPPRSENPSRINAAYAAFDAFGVGDDGKVTVRVVVPPGFTVDTLGSDATVGKEGVNTVYTATDIPNPSEFDIFVSARNDEALTSTEVTTDDGETFDLRTWPGDTEWQGFVTTQIEDGVPELATLVGRPWPIDGTVEVRQAYTPYLYGYAGWFSASNKEIEIGEDLDQEVVLHELSHAWFSDDWFSERWLNEGMAQVYSNLAVDEMDGSPVLPDPIDAADPGKVQLNDWNDPLFTDGADEVEAYGYNAAYSVVKKIVDEVGVETMREVFAAVDDGTEVYVGDEPADDRFGAADWRRFLDLVEELGGSETARDLLEKYVVTDAQADQLDQRDEARTQYAALDERGDEWAAPIVVRTRMEAWSFGIATDSMDDADAVLDLRDELDDKAKQLDATYPDTFEADYEAVEKSFDDVTAELQEQIDTAELVIDATAAEAKDDGLLATIGLWGTDLPKELTAATTAFEDGDHDTARAAAAKVTDTLAAAEDVGTTRVLWTVGGVVLFVLLVVLLVLLLRRRRRRRRAAAEAAIAAETVEPDSETVETDSETVEADSETVETADGAESGGGDATELDEDALAGAGEGGVDDRLLMPGVDDGEAP